jgi:hypothetical protein
VRAYFAALLIAVCGVHGRAAADANDDEPIVGFGPDAALTVGAGIGIDHALDTNVMARLRLGALFAYEPWVLNLGVTGELGALAEQGVGLEFELNHMAGPWLQINASRVADARWMGHAALGYAVVGIEWQHAFSGEPSEAVLLVLRLPAGIFWLIHQHEAQRAQGRE